MFPDSGDLQTRISESCSPRTGSVKRGASPCPLVGSICPETQDRNNISPSKDMVVPNACLLTSDDDAGVQMDGRSAHMNLESDVLRMVRAADFDDCASEMSFALTATTCPTISTRALSAKKYDVAIQTETQQSWEEPSQANVVPQVHAA